MMSRIMTKSFLVRCIARPPMAQRAYHPEPVEKAPILLPIGDPALEGAPNVEVALM